MARSPIPAQAGAPRATLVIKPQRDKSLRNRHPWVFAGSVARSIGSAGAGETVEVVGADGAWLGRGAVSPASQIRVRIWTFTPDEPVDNDFFRRRLAQALDVRRPLRGRKGGGFMAGVSTGGASHRLRRCFALPVATFRRPLQGRILTPFPANLIGLPGRSPSPPAGANFADENCGPA